MRLRYEKKLKVTQVENAHLAGFRVADEIELMTTFKIWDCHQFNLSGKNYAPTS